MKKVYEEQKDFFEFIKSEISNNKLSHAYLIETMSYDNTEDLITEFLKYILCKEKIDNIDCNCNLCNLVEKKLYPDIKYVDPDGSIIKKEQLIQLKDSLMNKSVFDNKQVYIINDATKLNSSSANTMLKFLEEPEDNIIAILVADNRYRVIDTIVSRCQIIPLREISRDIGQEIMLLSDLLFADKHVFMNYDKIIEIIPDRINALEKLKKVQKLLFDNINKNYKDFSSNIISKLILILEENIGRLEYNVNYKLLIDNLLVSISEVIK